MFLIDEVLRQSKSSTFLTFVTRLPLTIGAAGSHHPCGAFLFSGGEKEDRPMDKWDAERAEAPRIGASGKDRKDESTPQTGGESMLTTSIPTPAPTRKQIPTPDERARLLWDALHQCYGRGWRMIPTCWPTPEGRCACPKHHTLIRDIGKAPLLGRGYQLEDNWLSLEAAEAYWQQYPLANLAVLLQPAKI